MVGIRGKIWPVDNPQAAHWKSAAVPSSHPLRKRHMLLGSYTELPGMTANGRGEGRGVWHGWMGSLCCWTGLLTGAFLHTCLIREGTQTPQKEAWVTHRNTAYILQVKNWRGRDSSSLRTIFSSSVCCPPRAPVQSSSLASFPRPYSSAPIFLRKKKEHLAGLPLRCAAKLRTSWMRWITDIPQGERGALCKVAPGSSLLQSGEIWRLREGERAPLDSRDHFQLLLVWKEGSRAAQTSLR